MFFKKKIKSEKETIPADLIFSSCVNEWSDLPRLPPGSHLSAK